MKNSTRAGASVVVSACLFLGSGFFTDTQAYPPLSDANNQEKLMTHHASGSFEVNITPQPSNAPMENQAVSRMALDKQFHGDLEATSKGRMLAVTTDVEGSAGYVALEYVTGVLNGHSGSFVLQHSGTMARGAPQLSVAVVPDSGTGELAGLKGEMTINIVDEKHFYEFEYTLATQP